MSKRQKQADKLFCKPPPTDYRWEDLIQVMRRNGFTESCTGGSHYMFEHENGYRFSMSKTHPSGILKKYQIDAAKEALTDIKSTDIESIQNEEPT